MTCPVCGYAATRVNQGYWCPNDQIFLGSNLGFQAPINSEPLEARQNVDYQPGQDSKVMDSLMWAMTIVLFVVIILMFAWAYFTGAFQDTSIFQ